MRRRGRVPTRRRDGAAARRRRGRPAHCRMDGGLPDPGRHRHHHTRRRDLFRDRRGRGGAPFPGRCRAATAARRNGSAAISRHGLGLRHCGRRTRRRSVRRTPCVDARIDQRRHSGTGPGNRLGGPVHRHRWDDDVNPPILTIHHRHGWLGRGLDGCADRRQCGVPCPTCRNRSRAHRRRRGRVARRVDHRRRGGATCARPHRVLALPGQGGAPTLPCWHTNPAHRRRCRPHCLGRRCHRSSSATLL
ncbi:hypothetical protein BU14_1833s0002 [Porphyra umbilicalis]|uniref:Uncharacterized protein n=1 Tax=Porphyra umbilicalis TaxID=2786 RepID=A0A1X6NKQ5_PORUM|nr:hypothetical protein BU14_1833s0002 [Porphyra umbilicalis]|eukprot:OSX69120.1 hypothetical protein BU14_1833s0002 [Porphyra umbilicalis]